LRLPRSFRDDHRDSRLAGAAGSRQSLTGSDAPLILVQILGLFLIMAGIALFASTLRRFATEGKGTLAPWDPPRSSLCTGRYRYVRNPMISGVLIIILGEALVLLSRSHFWWFLTFFVINAVYIPLLEEPLLKTVLVILTRSTAVTSRG
jgi:protein-S-isoprenylcysteine O-methyltransferase Ste14